MREWQAAAKKARPVTSLVNLRRSVTGTLATKLSMRPKSALVVDTSVATVSHPPVSMPAARPRPRAQRQALSPTMHNRASIIVCAGAIEDEESRRLSEAAFLDF